MSTATPAADLVQPEPVSARWLWVPYLVPALLLGMVGVDMSLSLGIAERLPDRPEQLFGFELLFGFPHILASLWVLARQPTDLWFFRKRIAVVLLAISALGLGSLTVLPVAVVAGVWMVFTLNHVLKQQYGLARRSGFSDRLFWAWTLSGLAPALVQYAMAYEVLSGPTATHFVRVGVLLHCLVGGVIWRRAGPRHRVFLLSTILLVPVSILLFQLGYPVLGVLAPRAVHDLTAMGVYALHDRNRAAAKGLSPRGAAIAGLSVVWVGVLAGFLMRNGVRPGLQSLGMTEATAFQVWLLVKMFVDYMHYGLEPRVWRRGSPFQPWIRFH